MVSLTQIHVSGGYEKLILNKIVAYLWLFHVPIVIHSTVYIYVFKTVSVSYMRVSVGIL